MKNKVRRQFSFESELNNTPDMLLVLVLILGSTTAEELVEETQMPHCKFTRILQEDETTTEPPPPFPMTSFTCWGRYDGYYADVEVDCTIFHYCQTWHFPTGLNETVKWDFACPQSTIFNQKILSCTPPNISFDCQESPNYYWVNYNLTSATTTGTPITTPDFSTPISDVGQQLIVGGLEQHSASLPDSVTPEIPASSSDLELPSSPALGLPPSPALDLPPSPALDIPSFPSAVELPSSSVHFPIPSAALEPPISSIHTDSPVNFPDHVESGSGSDLLDLSSSDVNSGNDTKVINFPM